METHENHPKHHTQKMKARLRGTTDHGLADVERVDDPRFQAMFETAAEALGGLVKAFEDCERANEPAWRG